MESEQQILDEIVARIVAEVRPQRIILFGSRARGEAAPESDIDLLIVVPEGTHRRHVAQRIYRNLLGITVPFDIVVATPSDLAKYGDNPVLIYSDVLAEGKTLYAA
ncbi:MAG: nucleotidyltransferase domain-containing protein [Anaerolineae bacterium]